MKLSLTELGRIGRLGPIALVAFQPAWEPVIGDPPAPLPDGEARATDEDAAGTLKFYRLIIE